MMKEQAYNQISELVKRFEEQYDSYKNGSYNETATRRDFIDPFFKALGWDIDNSQGAAEAYREVIHEDKVTIDDQVKSPDYSFRLQGGKRLFFVEAKKPSIFIKESIPPAYQVKRYAWSAKLPISILTDFEEFAVYDCTTKPKPTDKASIGRIKYLTFREYLAEFDFLWNTFAKENVIKGSFDKFVLSDKGKKGTSTVDKEFLLSLDEWRKLLAVDISKNNKTLDESGVNHAVQQTIDRIIFLRICEDRNIEPNNRLATYVEGKDCYHHMFEYFLEADKKYNSGLFDFKKDTISKNLVIQDKVLKEIIEGLYYPKCPFEFSVLPVEILGSAYEQFLGKVIRLTAGHNAKVEEKPEVRKAGGVYYTPQYIVDYIVKNTVGKLVEGKTPVEIEKIKILDPACGSGSFLIGAYQYLLDWHLKYYNESGKKDKTLLTPDGTLTTAIKKKILLNNIFGVDLDAQAVEVTKLSLLLKCMEGETQASIKNQMAMFHERVLPSLETNIKCGNSLIGTDFYNSDALNLFGKDDNEHKRINAFDWDGKDAFPEIMKRGGFDVIIGNPPYVAVSFNDNEKKYFNMQYTASQYQLDLYILFMEKGVLLLKQDGYIGLITPNSWLKNLAMSNCRLFLLENLKIVTIVPKLVNVFKDASVDTLIIVASKTKATDLIAIESLNGTEFQEKHKIEQKTFLNNDKYVFSVEINSEVGGIVSKLTSKSVSLDSLFEITRGVNPYDVYTGQSRDVIDNKAYHSDHKKDMTFVPEIRGKHVKRYNYRWDGKHYISYGTWLAAPRDIKFFKGERIVLREILGKNFECTYINEDFIIDRSLYIARLKEDSGKNVDIKYFVALLCSKLLAFYFRYISNEFDALFPKIRVAEFKKLPILIGDLKLQKRIVEDVSLMLELNKKLILVKNEAEKTIIQRQINGTDKQIDKLVYELYGLTEDEIKIVEGRGGG